MQAILNHQKKLKVLRNVNQTSGGISIRVEQGQVRRGLISAGQLVLANRSRYGDHYPLS